MEKFIYFFLICLFFFFALASLLSNKFWNNTKKLFSYLTFFKTFELRGELTEPPYEELDAEFDEIEFVRGIEDPDEPVLVKKRKIRHFISFKINEKEQKKEIPYSLFDKLENSKKTSGSPCTFTCRKFFFQKKIYVLDVS